MSSTGSGRCRRCESGIGRRHGLARRRPQPVYAGPGPWPGERTGWRPQGSPGPVGRLGAPQSPDRPPQPVEGIHEQLRDSVVRRPRGGRPDRPGARPPADDPAADRVGELHLAGGAGRHRLGVDQQVLRGLPGPPLLRRQPDHRRGGGPGPHRATALFGAEHANVQPHAGANANLAAYQALLEPGATILAMRLDHGGHLTHGSPASIVSKFWRFVSYGVTPESSDPTNPGEVIDFDQVAHLAKTEKPALIVAGSTAYARVIDPLPFREIADSVGRPLHVRRRAPGGPHRRRRPPEPGRGRRRRHLHDAQDAARPARRRHPVRRPTWPRRSTARCSPAYKVARSSTSSPPRRSPSPRRPAGVPHVRGAGRRERAALAEALAGQGFRLVSGGTDNHMLLVDLRPSTTSSRARRPRRSSTAPASRCNRNTIPDDPRSPFLTSGLRLGTAAETTAGMGPAEMQDDRRPDRAHPQGPHGRGRRSPPSARRWPRCAPPSRRIPTSWDSACQTSAGTAWSW